MNDAAVRFPEADYAFTLDTLHLRDRFELPEFKGTRIAAVPPFYGTEQAVYQCDRLFPNWDVVYVPRVFPKEGDTEEVIVTGCSGYGAYQLAYKNGAEQIFLFGCDHSQMGEYFYGKEFKIGQLPKNWNKDLVIWNEAPKRHGTWNVSPFSKIESQAKMTWKRFCEMNNILTSPIVTVMKTGGEYNYTHVNFLYEQLEKFNLGKYLICLTDDPNGIKCATKPLFENLPGWWSKMEMFAPWNFFGNFLYMDLDTVILGDISPFLNTMQTTTVLRDFYHPTENIGSGLMFIEREDCAQVWDEFIKDPIAAMKEEGPSLGDQRFLNKFFADKHSWDPDLFQSYKVDFVSKKRNIDDAMIMCFHGQPRPWNVDEPWIMKGEWSGNPNLRSNGTSR